MTLSKNRSSIFIILMSLALGLCCGTLMISKPDVTLDFSVLLPRTVSVSTFKDYLLPLCKTAVLESLLLYISGFTFHPNIVCIPILILRGAAAILAVRSFGLTGKSVAIIISYIIITFLMTIQVLSANNNSAERSKNINKTYFHYTYSFLMINGAIIAVKSIPYLILSKI